MTRRRRKESHAGGLIDAAADVPEGCFGCLTVIAIVAIPALAGAGWGLSSLMA